MLKNVKQYGNKVRISLFFTFLHSGNLAAVGFLATFAKKPNATRRSAGAALPLTQGQSTRTEQAAFAKDLGRNHAD